MTLYNVYITLIYTYLMVTH